MIRIATENDIPSIKEIIKEFIDEAPSFFVYNEEYIERNIFHCVFDEDGLALVMEKDDDVQGILLGIVSTHPMFGTSVATELAWYVRPAYRKGREPIKLMVGFMEWSQFKGTDYILTADISGLGSHAKLYDKLGFTDAEHTYFRKL